MAKPIYEYEFLVAFRGKQRLVQQSAHSATEARRLIKTALSGVTILKLKKRFSYPHLEGGKKVK